MKQVKTFFIQNILKNKILINSKFVVPKVKKYLFYLALFIGLILFNYLFSKAINGGQEFFINWAAARILFIQRIDPYSQEAFNNLSELAKELVILPSGGNVKFTAPLYSLFVYLPFALIQNFGISKTIWITAMELIALISGSLVLSIFNWQPDKLIKRILFVFSLTYFYTLINLITGSNLILLNFIFLLGVKWILDEKYLMAGIIFALLTMDISTFLIPLIAVFFYCFRKKAWAFPIWYFVSFILMSLSASLLIPDWPLGFLREILRNPILANFALPGEIINQWFGISIPWIWNYLALILSFLLVYEFISYENEKSGFLWKIGLALVLNPLIWMKADLNIIVTLLFPFLLIFFQWINRDKHFGSILIILLSLVFSVGLVFIGLFTKSILLIVPFPFFLYIFPIIILLINLYWIRWWMVRNNSTNNY